MLRRLAALLVTVALVSSGCGSGEPMVFGTGSPDSGPAEASGLGVEIDPEVLAAAQTIVERLGPDGGFGAVALALDAGYGVDQIAEGASGLSADGTIPGVTPFGEGAGRFALILDGGFVLAAGAEMLAADGDDLSFLRDRFRVAASASGFESDDEIGAFMVGALLHLVAVGYSMDQIVDGIVFQEVRLTSWEQYSWKGACFALAADDGSLVAPELVPPAWEVWEDSTKCHESIWEGDVGFYAGCDNDVFGICTDGDAVAGSTTSTTTPNPAVEPSPPGSYTLEGSLTVAGEGSEVSVTWTGAFEATDGRIAGSGSATATSEGACRINDGREYRYSFTAVWDFEVGGAHSEESLQVILTPTPGTSEVTTGPGTEDGACVGFARDFLAGFAVNPIGLGPPYEIVVPDSGGSTRVGTDPLWLEFTIEPASQ